MTNPQIFLIQAQASPPESGLRNEKWYQPLGLLSIATVLEGAGFNRVRVFDADHDPTEEIITEIQLRKPDIVGLNFNVFNTSIFDQMAAEARMAGSLVVAGGPAATPIPRRLLSSNSDIDAVVVYDGERPMLRLAREFRQQGKELSVEKFGSETPNVITRTSKGSYRFTTAPSQSLSKDIEVPNLVDYPIINRSAGELPFKRYLHAWNRPEIDPERKPVSIYLQKGCGRTCTFCARIDKHLRQRPLNSILKEIQILMDKGANYLYIVDDTISADQLFLENLLKAIQKSGTEFPPFWAFADIRDLEDGVISLLSRLGAEKLLIGIETGSEELRRKSAKAFSNKLLFERLEKLARVGIKVEDSYVLGLPGETWETLEATYQVAKQVQEVCHTEGTAFNMMTPLLGSPDWNRMMNVPSLKEKYGFGYQFDIMELRDDFFREFCLLPGEGLAKSLNAIS